MIKRRMLVTGADGFMGSHLVDSLLARGNSVVAVVRRTSRSQSPEHIYDNLGKPSDRTGLEVVGTDLSSSDSVRVLAEANCDVWFHLAADAFVDASLRQPLSVLSANVSGTAHVLEAARIARPQHVLVTSSSEVYGSHEGFISENMPLRPHTPYAASKVAADRLSFAYAQTYGVPITIVRPFNCYGPRHPYDVIPIFLLRAIRGEPMNIFGDGSQWRDFTYVSDTVRAFELLSDLKPQAEVYNVGSGASIPILELANTIGEVLGVGVETIHSSDRPGDVHGLLSDSSKLTATTGWLPQVSLREGLWRHAESLRESAHV